MGPAVPQKPAGKPSVGRRRLSRRCLLQALWATLLMGLGSVPAHAVIAPMTLVVGYYDFPPSIYTDAQGRPQGPVLELTTRIARHAGFHVRFRLLPSARLYAALKDGSIDLWVGASGKPELAAHTLESRVTLSRISLNLYFRPDTPPPQLPGDLARRDLIIIGGYSYWPAINEILTDPALGVRLRPTANHVSALEMLRHRRADYLLGYQIPVNQARHLLGIEELPFVPMRQVSIKFIVSRYASDSQAILAALERAYGEMAAAGEQVNLPGESQSANLEQR